MVQTSAGATYEIKWIDNLIEKEKHPQQPTKEQLHTKEQRKRLKYVELYEMIVEIEVNRIIMVFLLKLLSYFAIGMEKMSLVVTFHCLIRNYIFHYVALLKSIYHNWIAQPFCLFQNTIYITIFFLFSLFLCLILNLTNIHLYIRTFRWGIMIHRGKCKL